MQRPWRNTAHLACSPWFAQSASLHNPEPSDQGWHHPQWLGPSTPIISHQNAPIYMPPGQSNGDNFEVTSAHACLCQVDN